MIRNHPTRKRIIKMSELQNKIRLALNEEAHSTFGMSGYSFQTEEQLEEAKKSKKEEESEESSTSESSESCSSKKETALTEEEVIEIKLSASQLRSLAVASLAESLVNETINEDEGLETYGLLVEGKLTGKGREILKKFLPTLFAS